MFNDSNHQMSKKIKEKTLENNFLMLKQFAFSKVDETK